jgi:hypothetical protein
VVKTIGENYLNKIYGIYESPEEINFNELPNTFVIKTNHDSGSVFIIKDKNSSDIAKICKMIKSSLSKTYGLMKAEWPYGYIQKKIIVEKHIHTLQGNPPDYKFHCVNGKVKWLQYIFDRDTNTKEAHYTRDFERLPVHLDWDFELAGDVLIKPNNWDELLYIAEKLAAPFKYVRVDLYNVDEKPLFGELTFFPKGGYYPSTDIYEFGKMLDFELSPRIDGFLT